MATHITLPPTKLSGSVRAPASKSYLQRALAVAALATGPTTLQGVTWSDDTNAVRSIIQVLGAQVRETDGQVVVTPGKPGSSRPLLLDAGESGLALRMFAPLAALLDREVQIHGHKTLLNRPLQPIIETLGACGVTAYSHNGQLPLTIKGPLRGGEIAIDASFSSQVLTGLLIALPLCSRPSRLRVSDPVSLPYIAMTLEVIRAFGVKIDVLNPGLYEIPPLQRYHGCTYRIEGDWSAAANLLVAGALSGPVHVPGLDPASQQADSAILDALRSFGARLEISEQGITSRRAGNRPFRFDATHSPDLFPPLAILAAAATGTSEIRGAHRLRFKESDRLATILSMLSRLGVHAGVRADVMYIHGTGQITAATIHSHGDHRIAMAAAVASSIAEGPVTILAPEAVGKSYPGFFEDLEALKVSAAGG